MNKKEQRKLVEQRRREVEVSAQRQRQKKIELKKKKIRKVLACVLLAVVLCTILTLAVVLGGNGEDNNTQAAGNPCKTSCSSHTGSASSCHCHGACGTSGCDCHGSH